MNLHKEVWAREEAVVAMQAQLAQQGVQGEYAQLFAQANAAADSLQHSAALMETEKRLFAEQARARDEQRARDQQDALALVSMQVGDTPCFPPPPVSPLNLALLYLQAREQATAAAAAVQAAAAAATTAAANQVAASTAAAIAAARLGLNNNNNNTTAHAGNVNAANVGGNAAVAQGITGKKRASESRPAERAVEMLRHATLPSATTHGDEEDENDEYSLAFLDESTSHVHRDTSQSHIHNQATGNAAAHTYPKGRGR